MPIGTRGRSIPGGNMRRVEGLMKMGTVLDCDDTQRLLD